MELEFTNSWERSAYVNYDSVAETRIVSKPGLMDALQGPQDSVFRFHVAVEGAAASGKTKFIRSLLGSDSKDLLPTHGVAVHQLVLTVGYKGEPRTCSLYLWEYGAYIARKYDYVWDSVGKDQDASIHVLSILDRSSFQELCDRRDSSAHYSCVFLSKTDLNMQTNIFPREIPQLARDTFVDSKLLMAHVCGKLLESRGL